MIMILTTFTKSMSGVADAITMKPGDINNNGHSMYIANTLSLPEETQYNVNEKLQRSDFCVHIHTARKCSTIILVM